MHESVVVQQITTVRRGLWISLGFDEVGMDGAEERIEGITCSYLGRLQLGRFGDGMCGFGVRVGDGVGAHADGGRGGGDYGGHQNVGRGIDEIAKHLAVVRVAQGSVRVEKVGARLILDRCAGRSAKQIRGQAFEVLALDM